ncbi:Ig-like domain-containing protein [Robertmurraya siralis]|uniref:Ig-like domain-containing protein n=1 Tax=Robertmurraya siralis TaxID=77777 RepID=UPI0010F4CB9A|nr:Ig-like domain-containing protein [Robertmurraya siralis]
MPFKIYQGSTVIAEGESPLAINGLEPNTEVTAGEYQAVRVDGERESERVDIPGFTTLAESEPDQIEEPNVEPEEIDVRPQTNNFSEQGVVRYMTATVLPEEADQTVTWESEDTNIALIDAEGKVTARNPGTTTIIATASNGVTGTATINCNWGG